MKSSRFAWLMLSVAGVAFAAGEGKILRPAD